MNADEPPAFEVSVADAKDRLAELIRQSEDRPVFLTEHGAPVAVLVAPEEWERVVEDSYDLEHVLSRREDDDEDRIPFRQFAADHGIEVPDPKC